MKRYRAGPGLVVMLPFGAMVAVGMPSCSSSSAGVGLAQNCSLNSDCDKPLVCVFAKCHSQCATASDCMTAGERCVPAGGDAGAVNVCQLASEQSCTAASSSSSQTGTHVCNGGEVCGSDDQCRAPCQTSDNCLSGQTCLPSGSGKACFDPNDPRDDSFIQLSGGSDAGTSGGSEAGTKSDAGSSDAGSSDAAAMGDGASVLDSSGGEPVDGMAEASYMANADATLGFTIPNVGPVEPAGGDGGGGDVMVTQSGNDTSLLPAPAMITTSGGAAAALYTFNSFSIVQNGSLRFTGTLPIIVVARTSVNIQGQILVNGNSLLGAAGPGGFYGTNGGPGQGKNGASAGDPNSGSGGGSFCGIGGSGGSSGPAAAGGTTYGTANLIPLIGGSAGGVWDGQQISGPGGGAIEIVAGQSITIGQYGVIHAGGGGGGGYVYGGGAGSGGAILLEAPMVTIDGTLAANGGGGGQAEGSVASGVGADGTANATPASGYEGIGGAGSAGTVINGGTGLVPDAGTGYGAGGGGAGRIRINTANGSATIGPSGVISPALSTACATQGTLN